MSILENVYISVNKTNNGQLGVMGLFDRYHFKTDTACVFGQLKLLGHNTETFHRLG